MKRRHGIGCLSASLLFLLVETAVAADVAFDKGVSAFKNHDYVVATDWFEQARDQGNQSAILAYNLAASYYKLGRLVDARHYFEEAAQDNGLAGLSYYNLGLIALKDNDEQAARRFFYKSLDTAKDETLSLLAAQRLDELGEDKAGLPSRGVNGFASLSLARDDNVTRVNEDIPTAANASDNYLDFYGTLGYWLRGSRDNGMQLRGGLIMTRYSDLSLYNEDLISLGVYLTRPLGKWRGRAGAVFYHDSLDGSAFQRRLSLQLRADNDYAPGQRLRFNLDLTRYSDIDSSYAYLSGSKQRFTLENRSRRDNEVLYLGYRFEINDREDLATLSSYSDYSPTRYTLYGVYEHKFNDHWLGRGMLDYRSSHYDADNIRSGVSQGVRKEDRTQYGLTAVYSYDRDTEFEAKWRRLSNRSNYISENYNSSMLMFSANHYF